jgi:hypothetical protein
MKKLSILFVITSLTVLLGACSTAQKSSEIHAVRMPVAPYLKLSCKELATEQSMLIREAESAGAQVDAAYDSDKGAELVAWILFAPAAFMLEGNQEESTKLAGIKGQLEAIREAQSINKCTSR